MTILGTELLPLSDSVPVITEVYDLLSGKHDGTITPWAPIIVSGSWKRRSLNWEDVK